MIWVFVTITLIGLVMLVIAFLSFISPKSLIFIIRFLELVESGEKQIGKCVDNICKYKHYFIQHVNTNISQGIHIWALRR